MSMASSVVRAGARSAEARLAVHRPEGGRPLETRGRRVGAVRAESCRGCTRRARASAPAGCPVAGCRRPPSPGTTTTSLREPRSPGRASRCAATRRRTRAPSPRWPRSATGPGSAARTRARPPTSRRPRTASAVPWPDADRTSSRRSRTGAGWSSGRSWAAAARTPGRRAARRPTGRPSRHGRTGSRACRRCTPGPPPTRSGSAATDSRRRPHRATLRARTADGG